MGLVETEGLVLRTYNLSDADKIAVFLTLDEGLIRGVAKGAKRLKSRFSGSLEQFSIVNLTFFQKEDRELVSIRDIELAKSYFKDAGNIEFLKEFSYLAELLMNFAPPHDPNERLYNMSKVCLQTVSAIPESLLNIVTYFEIWILRLGGYLPVWDTCNFCKKEFNYDEFSYLQNDFQISCLHCRKVKSQLEITPQQRLIFLKAQRQSPERFYEFSKDMSEDIANISALLKKIISQTLGKDITNQKILAIGK